MLANPVSMWCATVCACLCVCVRVRARVDRMLPREGPRLASQVATTGRSLGEDGGAASLILGVVYVRDAPALWTILNATNALLAKRKASVIKAIHTGWVNDTSPPAGQLKPAEARAS